MPQSLSQIYIHIVFSTKYRYPFLKDEKVSKELFAYIGGICNALECQFIKVGGYVDHDHILCRLSRKVTVAKLVREVKRNSSKWIKTKGNYFTKFAWQNGYGVFSIGKSEINRMIKYIDIQKGHHLKTTFKEELINFLRKYNLEYDDRYLFD